jgi:hypothetical protein
LTNKKQELPMTAMFVTGSKLFQSRRFLEINQSETRIACGDHVI